MASPATFEVTSATFGPVVHNIKSYFGKLFLRQILAGTGGVGSGANLVDYGQGMCTFAGNWQNWFIIVFDVQRGKSFEIDNVLENWSCCNGASGD